MNKSTIKIEYDGAKRKKRVERSNKTGSRMTRSVEMVDVKDPRCWEVITVENTISYTPGQHLTKKQVAGLCSGAGYHIEIGLPGQFRERNDSRY
jgi:hypothetical protein